MARRKSGWNRGLSVLLVLWWTGAVSAQPAGESLPGPPNSTGVALPSIASTGTTEIPIPTTPNLPEVAPDRTPEGPNGVRSAVPPEAAPSPALPPTTDCPVCPPPSPNGKQEPSSHKLGHLFDSLHDGPDKGLFDSLNPEKRSGHWYDKFSIRGYTQVRWNRTLDRNEVDPQLLGDRNVDGDTENFSIRRMRLIFFGDVGEHLSFYIQPDFASGVSGQATNQFYAQLRDAYADIYIDTDRVHRFRVGLSKVPFGWENMQSSQNRLPLDRSEAINIGVNPNERDLGVFYYWTPVDKQKLLKDLVDGGLKGSGNYGIFAFGIYNGQGGSQFEQNRNLHMVSRLTYPFQLDNGQVIEASIQGYLGEFVVQGASLRPLGVGPAIIPVGTLQGGNDNGLLDRKAALSFIYYPQPIGFQAEWSVGNGPGLEPDQRSVSVRANYGGYVMTMYKFDTMGKLGIFTPYFRYELYNGGYRSLPNAPFGRSELYQVGLEWQPWKYLEITCEYTFAERTNTATVNAARVNNYQTFEGNIFRVQCQFNY